MKKKLALLLAAVMVAAMVPVTAFAASENRVNKVVTVKADTTIAEAEAPSIVIKNTKSDLTSGDQFFLTLDGAKWQVKAGGAYSALSATDGSGYLKVGATAATAETGVILLDDNTLSVTLTTTPAANGEVKLPLLAKVTGEEATVTVDPAESPVSAGTYVFARTTSAGATAKTNGAVNVPEESAKTELKSIVITETVAKAFEVGEVIKLRLYGDFEFVTGAVTPVTTNGLAVGTGVVNADKDEVTFTVTSQSTKAGKISVAGLEIKPLKDAKAGDVAEIVISSNKDTLEKTTLEVANVITYGIKFTAADKKLPVFYAGSYNNTDATLEVTFEEAVADSWWSNRKTTLTFPEGVKVISATITAKSGCTFTAASTTIDGNEVEILPATHTGKAKWTGKFYLSISPDFTGDITCVLGGPAVPEDVEVVVAEAQKAVTVEAVSTDVSIDYRNVAIGDITITEAFAGALEKGAELTFSIDEIQLEKGAKIEVVEGDIEFEDIALNRGAGTIKLTVKKESYKTPAVVKVTNVKAYLDRSLPAGSYSLKLTSANASGATKGAADDNIIKNYATKAEIKAAKVDTADGWACFNIDSYTISDTYVEVVTAGRDQDDSSFTTQVAITIGADTMTVGQKTVALEVPAYIANGYTMLPVRAVADALSGEAATVLWDDATKTVTIAFGARIISMTIGSKTMNINGVAIQMNAAPEITNNRTFLPLRDLGYALGLTDADINWNAETATATLN